MVLNLSVGEKVSVTCPANKAYGARGIPGTIPENAELIFEMHLISIKSNDL